jgi:hypothetical protein
MLAIFALVAPALARVYNMTAPATGTQGTNITAVLYSESYIQNWDDFGVSRSHSDPSTSFVFLIALPQWVDHGG